MSTGYTRQDVENNIDEGLIINASDLNSEFNALEAAFAVATGHAHDGTVGGGARILVLGPSGNITVSSAGIRPTAHNDADVGTTLIKFKDGHFQGQVRAVGGFVGVASEATRLETGRTFALSGAATGVSPAFTGLADITIPVTALNASNLDAGTVPSARLAGPYTGITGVGTLNAGNITSGFGNINIGGSTFTGNGSGLTQLSASSLTGTIDSARIAGIYSHIEQLTNLEIVQSSEFQLRNTAGARFIGKATDSAGQPSYGWGGGMGMYRGGDTVIAFSTNGARRARITNTQFILDAGVSFAGSGAGITDIPSGALPTGTGANSWVGSRYATLDINDIGIVRFFKNVSGGNIGTGDTTNGSNLRSSSTAANEGGTPTGTWQCLGQCPDNSASLFQRVS